MRGDTLPCCSWLRLLPAAAAQGYSYKVDDKDVVGDVHAVIDAMAAFSEQVRSGAFVGATGKKLTNVISVGIGGSYLGSEFVYEALRFDKDGEAGSAGRTLRFLANVDPVDVSRALAGLDPESTLVVICSKTFTTAETMLNARTVRDWLVKSMAGQDQAAVIRQHVVAVSAAIPKARDFGIAEENVFGFWDWVGGRYSVCSAVGLLPLSLHFGMGVMSEFLAGAHAMDKHFCEAPLDQNLPVLMALVGVWNSSFLGHPVRAMLPYSQALLRFPAHIQQVDMESNGKRVTLDGDPIPPGTGGEIVFGEPGTNGQHSFYQLLHQGRVVPCEFIASCASQAPRHIEGEVVSNHDELMSNFFAQPDALVGTARRGGGCAERRT